MKYRTSIMMAIDALIGETSKNFDEKTKETKIKNWHLALNDLTDQQIAIGLENTLKHGIEKGFMPSSSDFRKFCLSGKSSDIDNLAAKSWQLVMDNLNHTISPVFQDSAITETIRMMGGWRKLCMMETREEPFLKKEFVSIFKTVKNRNQEYDNMLIGWGDIPTFKAIGFDNPQLENKAVERAEIEFKNERKNTSKLLEMMK